MSPPSPRSSSVPTTSTPQQVSPGARPTSEWKAASLSPHDQDRAIEAADDVGRQIVDQEAHEALAAMRANRDEVVIHGARLVADLIDHQAVANLCRRARASALRD